MQWGAVILCSIAIAINYMDRSSISIANLDIRKEFGINATQFGLLQSIWSLSYAVSQIPTGFLIDRIGPGVLLGVSLILWSGAQAAGGFASTYTQLLAARFLLGVTESPAYPVAVRVTADWFPKAKRGLPTGVFNMGANLGAALAPPFLTWLIILMGWRSMFAVLGVLGVVASIVWFGFYRNPASFAELENESSKGDETGTRITGKSWRRLFRYRVTWGLASGGFCVGYGLWMYVTWLPGYLEGEHHVSLAKTGVLAAIPLFASIAGSFCGGYVSDLLIRNGVDVVPARKLPTALGLLGSGVFTGLAANATELTPAVVWISFAMFSLYLSIAAKWTLITAVAPRSFAASCSGIQNMGSYLGGACSPAATGFVVDQTGSFVVALAIGSTIMLVGAAIYYFVIKDAIPEEELSGAL